MSLIPKSLPLLWPVWRCTFPQSCLWLRKPPVQPKNQTAFVLCESEGTKSHLDPLSVSKPVSKGTGINPSAAVVVHCIAQFQGEAVAVEYWILLLLTPFLGRAKRSPQSSFHIVKWSLSTYKPILSVDLFFSSYSGFNPFISPVFTACFSWGKIKIHQQ